MRLLKKSEVTQKKAQARKQEIDEGVKIAQKVDAVRNTLAEEEANLDKFRTESVKNIKAELAPLEEKRDGLKKEVQELERTREQLLIPLTEEWEEVETAKKQIEKQLGS